MMEEKRMQLSEDTWVYVDEARSKLIVEIDIPKEDLSKTKRFRGDCTEKEQSDTIYLK